MKPDALAPPYEFWMTADGTIQPQAELNHSPKAHCMALEQGGIAYFPLSPFAIPQGDVDFLLGQKQLETSHHKNIAYRPLQKKLTGIDAQAGTDVCRLAGILDRYAYQAADWLNTFLSPYQNAWRFDFTSFRPLEEAGRKLRLRARNDLLHVDSFPTRPTHGARILRVFTNIHPQRERVWQTGEPFGPLAERFRTAVPAFQPNWKKPVYADFVRKLGIKQPGRPAYDRWMMRFHNFLKENHHYQDTCAKSTWIFPPGSSWAVYTDTVSHSVLSGQYALEQTFLISPDAMVSRHHTPIHILEQLYAS